MKTAIHGFLGNGRASLMRCRAFLATVLTLVFATGAWAQTVEYVHTDALGSPVAITNASGAVVERTVYEPYGSVVNRPLSDGPGFTGHVADSKTGLVYMQQRYYDPAMGRFLSMDPVTADGATGSNFNRYWYGANNPYKFRDPDGRFVGVDDATVLVGGFAVVAVCYFACPTIAEGIIDAGASIFHRIGEAMSSDSAPAASAPKSDTSTQDKKVPNPDGSKGKQDHQDAVSELEKKARGEAQEGETVVREKKIQGVDSNRRPDVQILDKNGDTRKVFEAERKPNSQRVQDKRDEYTELEIDHQIWDLHGNLQP